jgi:hypothetical protein
MLPENRDFAAGFRGRLVELQIERARVHCLAPIDLAYSKLAAGREKDLEFVTSLLHHKIVLPSELRRLIADANVEIRATMEDRLKLVLSKLERRREAARQQNRDIGSGRGM